MPTRGKLGGNNGALGLFRTPYVRVRLSYPLGEVLAEDAQSAISRPGIYIYISIRGALQSERYASGDNSAPPRYIRFKWRLVASLYPGYRLSDARN